MFLLNHEEIYSFLRGNGYETVIIGTEESDKIHKKAGMHILCNSASDSLFTADLDTKLSFGAVKVNLWHGVGVIKGVGKNSNIQKKIERRGWIYRIKIWAKKDFVIRTFMTLPGAWGNQYFLSPSLFCDKQFLEFGFLDSRRFIRSSYPRNCTCLFYNEEEKNILSHIEKSNISILYAPTFRDKESSFCYGKLANDLVYRLNTDVMWIQKKQSYLVKLQLKIEKL